MHWTFQETNAIVVALSTLMTLPTKCTSIICKKDPSKVSAGAYKAICNKVTFSDKPIDRLSANDIAKYNADCWLMSPPCQVVTAPFSGNNDNRLSPPYTQGGNMKDIDDPRSKALIHLIDLLPSLKCPPQYIFVETVKNFEVSPVSKQLCYEAKDNKEVSITGKACASAVFFGLQNTRMPAFTRSIWDT